MCVWGGGHLQRDGAGGDGGEPGEAGAAGGGGGAGGAKRADPVACPDDGLIKNAILTLADIAAGGDGASPGGDSERMSVVETEEPARQKEPAQAPEGGDHCIAYKTQFRGLIKVLLKPLYF
jgi:hypothetical protein